jgi:O-antigen/teichoic acid export membrane protein
LSNRFLKNTDQNFIYFVIINIILVFILNFLFTKIFTNFLSQDEFGILSIAKQAALTFAGICILQIPAAILRYGSNMSQHQLINQILNSAILVIFSFWIIFSLFLLILSTYSINVIPFSPLNEKLLVLFLSLTYSINLIITSIYRALQNGLRIIFSDFGFNLVSLAFGFLFYLIYKNVLFILFGMFLSQILILVFIIIIIERKDFKLSINNDSIKKLFNFSGPKVISYSIFLFSQYIILFLVFYYNGPSDLAIMNIAISTSALFGIFGKPIEIVFPSKAYKIYETDKTLLLEKISKTTIFIIFLIGLMFIGVFFLSKEVVILLSNKTYSESSSIIRFIFLGLSFYTLYNIYGVIPLLKYNTNLSSLFDLISSITSLIIAIVLIPPYSYLGGAIAYSSYYFLNLIFNIFYSIIELKVIFPVKNSFLIVSYLIISIFISIDILNFLSSDPFMLFIFTIITYLTLNFLFKTIEIHIFKETLLY